MGGVNRVGSVRGVWGGDDEVGGGDALACEMSDICDMNDGVCDACDIV